MALMGLESASVESYMCSNRIHVHKCSNVHAYALTWAKLKYGMITIHAVVVTARAVSSLLHY